MKFQSLKEWKSINESGKNAIPSSRSLTWEEAQAVYLYVQKKIAPEFGIDRSDMEVIGSYGKKREGETHGDLDIAVSSNAIGVEKDKTLSFIDGILTNMGFETKVMRGFKQVSAGIPIPGTNDIAQVDFMLSPDLEWSKFVYHSPNYRENESKYKGFIRNALLMAIITESSKNILKQSDEGVEELESNVIRYPEGIYKSRRSWKGKKGLIKTPKLLKDFDELITTNPQEVVNLVVGPKFSPEDISTFERLWDIILSPGYFNKKNLQDIIKKFEGNLRVQGVPAPEEAIDAYPNIFEQ